MFRSLFKTLIALALLLVVVVVGAGYFLNTDQYKSALQQAVKANLGYELEIAGEMSVNFFPSFGLSLKDVRLSNPGFHQEIASSAELVLLVDARELFSGRVLIQELSASNLHINMFTDANGRNIWLSEEQIASEYFAGSSTAASSITNAGTATQTTAVGNDDLVSIAFERLQISNARIDVHNVSQGVRYSIKNLNLDSNGSNIDGRPFDLISDFDVSSFDANSGEDQTLSMGIRSTVTADLNNGNISLRDINFNLTPMLLQGEIEISDLNGNPSVSGNFSSSELDIMGLMQTLGLSESSDEFTGSLSAPVPPISFTAAFSGDQAQLSITEAKASFADTVIQAEGNIRFATDFSPTNISYNIISNDIDLSPFLAEEEEEPAIEAAIAEGDAETPQPTTVEPSDIEIPVELLRSTNILGSLSISSIQANDFIFSDINVFTNIEDGVLDIEIQPISAFEGTLAGNIRLDSRTSNTDLQVQANISQLNIIDLAPSISRLNSVTGKLDVEANYTASGNSVNAMMDSLSGSAQFLITENTVDIGIVKQVFTAIAALSPNGDTVQQWPDVLQFSEVAGYILLQDGIAENQQIKIRMDNIDVSGSGGIDLSAETFDYDLKFTVLGEPALQTIQINELYHDVSWPVQCAANMNDEVSQYCRPDFTQVREIFTQIGANAVRGRLNDAIIEQVPDGLQDAARGLLRNIFNR